MTYPKRPWKLISDLNPEYIKGFPFHDSLDEKEEKYIYLAWLYANVMGKFNKT
jgi:hypothetical protein